MKRIIIGFLLASITLFASSPEELFDNKCGICHIKTMPKNKSELIAPAIFGVMRHVKMNYDTKKEAISFMNDYIMNPSKDKAICMERKIKRFGLMPSQKGNLSKDELSKITSWVYDNFPPKNFKGNNKKSCSHK